MNNITENWYIKKRKLMKKQIESGEVLNHKRKEFLSPNKKYLLSITPIAFEEDGRLWAYTLGKVFKKNKNIILKSLNDTTIEYETSLIKLL